MPGAARTEATDIIELGGRLGLAAGRIARLLRRRLSGSLSLSQQSALHLIERKGPVGMGELAEIEGVAAPTMTRIVDALENLGHVRRAMDPTDRRAVIISVTAKGRRLAQHRRESRGQYMAKRLSSLEAHERHLIEEALPVLEKLAQEEPS